METLAELPSPYSQGTKLGRQNDGKEYAAAVNNADANAGSIQILDDKRIFPSGA